MPEDAQAFLIELKAALVTFDRVRATQVTDGLIAGLDAGTIELDAAGARRALSELRRKRYFDLMERLAAALERAGNDSLEVRRQSVQAMLDQGRAAELTRKFVNFLPQTGPRLFRHCSALLGACKGKS